LGNQKKTNYALRPDMTREEFVKELLTGLTTPPGYFPKNVLMNINGYSPLETVLERGMKALNPDEFEMVANESGALLLDTRSPEHFSKGFIPNSINIGLESNFAMWVGELIPDIKQEILIIADPGKEEESIMRLARVGFDYSIGYLKNGFPEWKNAGKEIDTVNRITAAEFQNEFISNKPIVIDVRKKSEYDSEHIVGALNIPLNSINDHLAEFPKDKPFILHCAGGYRSMIAASILKQRGWNNFTDVIGGFSKIAKTDVPKTAYVCPSTLL
jgi:hydroxyacylglutathione hydrolase